MMKCEATGKVKHLTRGAALAHMRSLRLNKRGLVFPYLCPHCNYWHVGHRQRA